MLNLFAFNWTDYSCSQWVNVPAEVGAEAGEMMQGIGIAMKASLSNLSSCWLVQKLPCAETPFDKQKQRRWNHFFVIVSIVFPKNVPSGKLR